MGTLSLMSNTSRPTWKQYFMEVARVCATRATCDRRHVGAVITQENHIIATGYNGSPPNLPHCDEVGHLIRNVDGRDSCFRSTHAELNAILAAAHFGHGTKGAIMYITDQPCLNCSKAIISAGIVEVYFHHEYPDKEGIAWLEEAKVRVQKL
jgi:dCMP deaminase